MPLLDGLTRLAKPEVQTLNRLRAFLSHSALALGEAGLIALVVVVLVAGTALAGKGGAAKHTGGSGTIALVMVEDQNTNGAPNWNDTVTFTVTTTSTDRPFVSVDCYQNGAWVYTASAGFFPDYPWPATFSLSSGSWPGGAASCNARLYSTSSGGTRTYTLATMTFAVGG